MNFMQSRELLFNATGGGCIIEDTLSRAQLFPWIYLYPVNNTTGFPYTKPLDSAIQRVNDRGQ